MSQMLPAIAIMDRPINHPNLHAGGHKAWEMRPVTGPADFMNFPSRIVTDEAVRAASAFATDLAVHAQRTGTRPWLILPDALAALNALPATHRRLLCTDQPAAAILKPHRLSARVDENRTEESSLIVDVVNGAWTVHRHDPTVRSAGRIRLLCALTSHRVDVPHIQAELPDTTDRIALGNWARTAFWNSINPRLADPFAQGLNDPALKEFSHSWASGDADLLTERLKMIAWSESYLPDHAFPFEMRFETASSEEGNARAIDIGQLQPRAHPLVEEALRESRPIGWRLHRQDDDPLPRRSDWVRVPLRFTINIPHASGHQRVESHDRLAGWIAQRGIRSDE